MDKIWLGGVLLSRAAQDQKDIVTAVRGFFYYVFFCLCKYDSDEFIMLGNVHLIGGSSSGNTFLHDRAGNVILGEHKSPFKPPKFDFLLLQ